MKESPIKDDDAIQMTKVKASDAPFFVYPDIMNAKLSPQAFMVYIYTLWREEVEGVVDFKAEAMAEHTGMELVQVQASIIELQEKGWLNK